MHIHSNFIFLNKKIQLIVFIQLGYWKTTSQVKLPNQPVCDWTYTILKCLFRTLYLAVYGLIWEYACNVCILLQSLTLLGSFLPSWLKKKHYILSKSSATHVWIAFFPSPLILHYNLCKILHKANADSVFTANSHGLKFIAAYHRYMKLM